jgi:ATP-dependent DNA helicase RecG
MCKCVAQGIVRATDGKAYIRRGAQNLPQEKPEELKRLEYTKGVTSFEGHPVNASKELIVESPITHDYLKYVVPNQLGKLVWVAWPLCHEPSMPQSSWPISACQSQTETLPEYCSV